MRHSSVFPRDGSNVGIQGPTVLSCVVPYQRVPCVAVFAGYFMIVLFDAGSENILNTQNIAFL